MLVAESATVDEAEHGRIMALISERGLKATFGG
jgi:hypothetical protein